MGERGILIVVSAPSGAGKSTVLHKLMQERKNLRFSISATTRQPRDGEQDGVDYYFVSTEMFQKMIRENAFLEYAEYVGNYYGTPWEPVNRLLCEGCDVYLDIEVQGAAQVRQKCPEALTVFLAPPSLEELERRLTQRGTDAPEIIRKRLHRAEIELAEQHLFDYVVVNDDVARAAAEISGIIDRYREKQPDASSS